jgi:hypothetical protein
MTEIRTALKELFNQKCEGKRPLWRPKHRWEDSIYMDLKEIESEV